ncbi:imelysin family protein [Caenispirillum salinarum]|uniref:imelysin family protein n=1 Tax=Caenispirillum salinarum TaxID=859058 RepID=UPI003851591C
MLRTFLAGAALLWAAPVLAAAPDFPTETVLTDHIQPRHAALHQTADRLHEAAAGLCADAPTADLDAVRKTFHDTMDAWAGVQHVTYGPIENFNRRFRLQFWPDPRNVLERELADLLREQPTDILAENGLTFASVAIQGLPMVERLTFGPHADALADGADTGERTYRCRLLEAVTANVAAIAEGLESNWRETGEPWPAAFRDPAAADLVADDADLAGLVLTGLTTQLQSIRDQRLLTVMGDTGDAADPAKAESALSGRSLRGIAASIGAMAEGFNLMFTPALAAAEPELADLMGRAFSQTQATAQGIDGPLGEAVTDPARRANVEKLATQVRALQQLLATRVAPALGLSLGFNSLDGD